MHVIYCRLIGILHGKEPRDQRGVFTVHHLRCSSRGDLERIAALRVQVTSFRASRRRDISADQGSLETFRFAIYQPRCIFLRILIETCLTVSRSPWHRPAAPPLSQMYLSGCYLTSPFFSFPLRTDIKSSTLRGKDRRCPPSAIYCSHLFSLSFFLSFFFLLFDSDSTTDVVDDCSLWGSVEFLKEEDGRFRIGSFYELSRNWIY